MTLRNILADIGVCVLVFLFHKFLVKRVDGQFPLPPGPRTNLLGHVNLPLPSQFPWKTYNKWRENYGNIIYMGVFGNPVVVLNTKQAAYDLLDGKSSMYSSRPSRPMVTELMGFGWLFSSMPYGSKWRTHRRLFHRHFNPTATANYRPIQIKETHSLLKSLLTEPNDFIAHIRRLNAAIVMMISYGHQIAPEDDHYVNLADKALASMAKAGLFGSFMVDYLPLLKYVPIWMPGAHFKRQALAWSKVIRAMINEPFEMVKCRMEVENNKPSLAACELETLKREQNCFYDEETVKNVSAMSYAAGAETSASVIMCFFLAMVLNPDVQRKAQEELDNVVGSSRLPSFEDYDNLPYLRAIVYECLRWHPVTPLSVAHQTMKADVYHGMRIPKNTAIIPNVWAMLHDEANYPEAMTFKPERYLETSPPGVNDYPIEGFGFGRRICPGRYLAEATVWITVASVLSVFHILNAIDENGNRIEVYEDFSSGFLSRPQPFPCQIKPRSQAAEQLIRQSADY